MIKPFFCAQQKRSQKFKSPTALVPSCNCKILEVACYSNLNNYRGSAVRDIRTPLGRFKLI